MFQSQNKENTLSEAETKFLEALKQNEDATAGLKLREEYPFLRERIYSTRTESFSDW